MRKTLSGLMKNALNGKHKTTPNPDKKIDYAAFLCQIKVNEFPTDPLTTLPPYILHHILLAMEDIKCILSCRLINKVMFLTFDEFFWQKMCYHSFFVSAKTKETWYETYKNVPPAFNTIKSLVTKYELLHVLGGRWNKVIQVRNKQTKTIHGLKIFKIDATKINQNSKVFYKYLNSFIHPFMVRIHELGLTEAKVYLVIDYLIDGLEARLLVLQDPYLSKKCVQFIMAQIVLVAEFMHSKGELFKCSSTDKIRLTPDGYIKFNWISKDILGTPLSYRISIIDAFEYSAPEFVEGGGFRLSCVFWGIGCLIYELLGGQPLLQNTATNLIALAHEILNLKVTFSNLYDSDSKDLLSKLLEKDPDKRLTSFELLKSHPFFESMDWHALLNMQIEPPDELKPRKPKEDDTLFDFLAE
eukprot:Phypoly_transcript_10560.p1 GENE.Phypoly_transcript_10560~~Phypoly_transcript_10560.p1  ORF type:complete len:426 (+),score=48.42 Phypoly_transcript_10560:41-1279(+)